VKIETSLDWQKVRTQLTNELNSIGYNPDLNKMLSNINPMVTELSKLEVEARRTRKKTYCDNQIEKINNAINHLEKLLLIAKLMN
jgi:hypothetical protein